MKLLQAASLAAGLVEAMRPYCHRIEIAGSIRRYAPEVKDIEIVAVPKIEQMAVCNGLFQEEDICHVNLLREWAMTEAAGIGLTWIKTGTHEVIPWEPKTDRQWRGYLAQQDVKLDLFLTTRERWGAIFLIRTGSAEFSAAVMAHAKANNRYFEGGALTIAGVPVETREEADVFRLLGLNYVEPDYRRCRRDVWRAIRREAVRQ